MKENKIPADSMPVQEDAQPAQKPAQNDKQPKKIWIDPGFEWNKSIVTNMVDGIANAIRSPGLEFSATPGVIGHFSEFKGKSGNHSFIVKYTVPKGKIMSYMVYVSYDNYEFETKYGSIEIGDLVEKIDEYVNKNYIYDFNSKSYVPRPQEPKTLGGFLAKFLGPKVK